VLRHPRACSWAIPTAVGLAGEEFGPRRLAVAKAGDVILSMPSCVSELYTAKCELSARLYIAAGAPVGSYVVQKRLVSDLAKSASRRRKLRMHQKGGLSQFSAPSFSSPVGCIDSSSCNFASASRVANTSQNVRQNFSSRQAKKQG
jgi:hypothetical protein